jgi:hypothetical protein
MSRAHLLRTLSAAALAATAASAAYATTTPAIINGGGATSPQGDYAGPNNSSGAPTSELSTFNAGETIGLNRPDRIPEQRSYLRHQQGEQP